MSDEIRLPSSHYDVIVLGTSLGQCILASAFARAGKTVLHMDEKDYYGGDHATLSIPMLQELINGRDDNGTNDRSSVNSSNRTEELAMFEKAIEEARNEAEAARAATAENDSSDPSTTKNSFPAENAAKVKQYAKIPNGGNTVKFVALGLSRSCFEGECFLEEEYLSVESKVKKKKNSSSDQGDIKKKHVSEETIPQTQSAGKADNVVPAVGDSSPTMNPNTADGSKNRDDAQTSEESDVKTSPLPTEAARNAFKKKKHRFCIDLDPRLMLSRGSLVDLLIRMDVGRYLEFRGIPSMFTVSSSSSSSARRKDSKTTTTSSSPTSKCYSMWTVPVSRSIVFKDPSLSLSDKRVLMRLMQAIQGKERATSEQKRKETASVLEQHMDKPFKDYLTAVKAPHRLQSMIMYSLVGADKEQFEQRTNRSKSSLLLTRTAITRLKLLLSSLGRYGPGAYLYPSYGTGEVPQAFTRLCAVHGGIYLLRFKPTVLVLENDDGEEQERGGEGKKNPTTVLPGAAAPAKQAAKEKRVRKKHFRGIITPSNQYISADILIGSRGSLPPSLLSDKQATPAQTTTTTTISRCVLITDGPLSGTTLANPTAKTAAGHKMCIAVAPPGTLNGNPWPVRMMQLDHVSYACPQGCFIVYLSCNGSGNARKDLEPVVSCLVRTAKNPDLVDEKDPHPMLLGSAYYKQHVRGPPSPPPPSQGEGNLLLPPVENVIIAEDLAYGGNFEGVVEQAETAFKRFCPESDFLPGRNELKTGEDKEGLDALMDFDADALDGEVKMNPHAQLFWAPIVMQAAKVKEQAASE